MTPCRLIFPRSVGEGKNRGLWSEGRGAGKKNEADVCWHRMTVHAT